MPFASQVSSVDAGGTFAASDAGQGLSVDSRNLKNQISIPAKICKIGKDMSFPIGPIGCHAAIAACCAKPKERCEIVRSLKRAHEFWKSVR